MILEPSPQGVGAPPEGPITRVVQWYEGRIKESPVGYGSPENGPGTHPVRKGVGGVNGNTFLLMIILTMVLLFLLISLGPLIFF